MRKGPVEEIYKGVEISIQPRKQGRGEDQRQGFVVLFTPSPKLRPFWPDFEWTLLHPTRTEAIEEAWSVIDRRLAGEPPSMPLPVVAAH